MIDIEAVNAAVFVGDGVHMTLFEQKLAEQVAAHLTGRDVEIWWCEPETKADVHAIGCVFRNGYKGLIQIRPGLERERAFSTLIHECAHIRLHWDILPFLSYWRKFVGVPGHYTRTPEKTASFNQREREADAQERYWLYYAGERGETVMEKLLALLSWRGA